MEMEGEVLVGSLKELATVLGQPKKEAEMLEDIQGLFHPFEGQCSFNLRGLFLPALTPVLGSLMRELRAAYVFTTFLIGFPLSAVPEEAFYYLQRLRNTLAEKRRQEGKGTRAGFAEIAFYPNYQLPTPSAIKAMPNDLIGSAALRAKLFVGEMVIFSHLSIILDRDTKIVYDHPCLEEALEGILCRISAYNPEHPSRAFLLIRNVSD
jgi:hypothetical protein